MPFVHLSAGGIPASPDEVWALLGPGFQSAAAAWRPAVYAGCRPARAEEIPPKLRGTAGPWDAPCLAPCRGRVVVPNPFLGRSEVVQTLIEYEPDRRELTWACGFPLPVVQCFFCTVYVVADDAGDDTAGGVFSKVHMECEWYPLPGFCWTGELLRFRERLAMEMRGPAGDLRDLKRHFEERRRRERGDGCATGGGGDGGGGPLGASPPFRATNEKGRPHRLRRGHHMHHLFCEMPRRGRNPTTIDTPPGDITPSKSAASCPEP